MTSSNPTSLYDFYTDQKFVNSVDKFNCVQTAILRYYLTAVTGKRLKAQRLDKDAIAKQVNKLKNISVDPGFDIDTHLNLIGKGGLMYGKKDMRSHISYGKRFFDFVSKSTVTTVKKVNKNAILSYKETIMDKSMFIKKTQHIGKEVSIKNDPNRYLDELKKKYPDLDNQELYKKAKTSLDSFFKVLENYNKYRLGKQISQATIDRDIKNILLFIGWYKEYRNLSVEELSIETVFPIINPYIEDDNEYIENLSDENFIKLAVEEKKLKIRIKKESKIFINFVNKYLQEYHDKSKILTKKGGIQVLINFAYFLFRDITDTEENDNYQDISLINRLRVIARDMSKIKDLGGEEEVIPFNWQEIEQVYERLRKEANQNYQFSSRNGRNSKGGLLSKRIKASHLQLFLAIAFFCVMPPDRIRTFRELTFGETLKYGVKNDDGTFTGHEQLGNKEEAKYYIHLLPHQYKTGKTYGTYWHEITNVKYKDGKYFYDYLNQWLFEGYRDELVKTGKTNAIFIRTELGVDYMADGANDHDSTSRYSVFIKNIFKSKTKFPLNPHALRSIYITHMHNLHTSRAKRESIAYMMHHDIETAEKIYNKQTSQDKMVLGLEFLKEQLAT